jgi:murein DD-endopeptidase MepM/ murein hydrolase activator NlpD
MERGMSRRSPRRCNAAAVAALLILAACNQSGRPAVVQVEQSYGAPPPGATPASAAAASGAGYTVIPGDTVYGVAERFQVPIRSLIELNALQPPYRLAAGSVLQIPAQREHVVQAGDSLYEISRRYNVDVSTLIRLNSIPEPYSVQPGQRLLLPSPIEAQAIASAEAPGAMPASPPPASSSVTVMELPPPSAAPASEGSPTVLTPPPATTPGTAAPAPQPSGTQLPPDPGTASGPVPLPQPPATPAPATGTQTATVQPPPVAVPQPAPLTGGQFLWPVNGKVIASFGPREGGLHNDGINISAPLDTPIRAAENGVVAYAGNELRGFGNMLLIRHADGWMTAYAHAATLLVKRGDNVVRGQTIARVGQTGNVSSPQLHFELRRGTEAIDPIRYLGELGAALPQGPAGVSPAGGPAALPDLG